ncbi:MAG: hypothetical protein HKN52_07785 [Eudoraea sp.]|nr:hypothetical protein [Eudoraea sp.]
MIAIAKYIIILFGLFLITVGFLMLLAPKKAREIIKKAGSTPLINFGELTIRMIPAIAMIAYASLSKYPEFFKLLGWFMVITSVLLLLIPRKYHHSYALWCASFLTPIYIRSIAPFSFLFGYFMLYSVL